MPTLQEVGKIYDRIKMQRCQHLSARIEKSSAKKIDGLHVYLACPDCGHVREEIRPEEYAKNIDVMQMFKDQIAADARGGNVH
jgi:hypothetical protein